MTENNNLSLWAHVAEVDGLDVIQLPAYGTKEAAEQGLSMYGEQYRDRVRVVPLVPQAFAPHGSVPACRSACVQPAGALDVMQFQFRHPVNGETRTVEFTRAEIAALVESEIFEKLADQLCECGGPVGETNHVDHNCDEYADEFELIAGAPAAPVVQAEQEPDGHSEAWPKAGDRCLCPACCRHRREAATQPSASHSDTSVLVEALLMDAVGVTSGLIAHEYNGNCPDAVNGHDKRDEACPACQVILRIEAAMAAKEVNP